MAVDIGGWQFGRLVLAAFGAMLIAGAIGLAAAWMR